MFIHEASSTVKKVLEKYTDNMMCDPPVVPNYFVAYCRDSATTTTQTHLSSHARNAVSKISPEKDASLLTSHISKSLASAIPKPILYYNYRVGECSDLIFGVSLVDYATARNLPDGEVPKIVRICVKEVDERGLNNEGIYRVSGRHAIVQEVGSDFTFPRTC
jgi:hypothetical protein